MENQIECMVCGTKNDGFMCPVCGFMSSAAYGDIDDADFAEEAKYADEYRAGMLARVKMKIPVYSYKDKIKDENRRLIIEEPDRDDIVIEGKNMKINEPVWFDEEFCNIDRDMPLEYKVVDIDGNTKNCSEVLANPEVSGETIKIGMILRPELKINIIVGKDEKYTCSGLHNLK